MVIIMLGAPGAGKGTIASQISETYNYSHVSTGDIFRSNISQGTEIGNIAKSYIDKGTLVPDEVTIKMMADTIANFDKNKGMILDGFPRNLVQAEGLDTELTKCGMKIDHVLLVDAEDSKIAERLSGRRVCEKCGATYHIVNMPSKVDGVCDKCGSSLVTRKDDTIEIINDRLKTYHEATEPLIEYYKNKGLLQTVDGFEDKDSRMQVIDTMLKAN